MPARWLQASHRSLNLETDTEEECKIWMTALRYVIAQHQLSNYQRNEKELLEDESLTGGGGGGGGGYEHGRTESNSVGSSSSGGGGGSSGGGLLSRTMSSFWRPRATKQNDKSGRADSVASTTPTRTTRTTHSDATRLTDDVSERSSLAEPPPGMMLGGEKERTHALVTMADVSSRGQLMAMEERHDVLRYKFLTKQQEEVTRMKVSELPAVAWT